MKNRLLLLTAATLLGFAVLIPSRANAQFVNGSDYIGPEIGLATGYGSGFMFGGMFEAPITHPGSVGPGLLGISVRVDYFGWSYPDWTISFIPIGVICDYHFGPMLSDPRWDPFVGLGLGFVIANASYSGPPIDGFNPSASYGSTVFFTGQFGARYFFSPSMAIRAEYGFSYTGLSVGLDFRL
jgi:Outer membrane protein beta-barrel domain